MVHSSILGQCFQCCVHKLEILKLIYFMSLTRKAELGDIFGVGLSSVREHYKCCLGLGILVMFWKFKAS